MALDDYPLLHVPDLMLAVLRAAAARGEATVEDGVALLQLNLRTAGENPPVTDAEIAGRLEGVRDRLAAAGLLEAAGDDGRRFRLTALGRRVLDENPDGVDGSVLERYVEPEKLLAGSHAEPAAGAEGTAAAPPSEAPPRQREYDEGAAAFRGGRDISANPYPLQTGQHQAWEAGWSGARDEATGPPPLGG